MIDARDISGKAETVRRELRSKLGVRSTSLRQALRRAGRRLPRRVRRQGEVLLRAEKLAENPRLARQLHPSEVETAYRDVTAHLKSIDAADLRRGWWLSLAGSIATNLLLAIAALFAWLWWRGFV